MPILQDHRKRDPRQSSCSRTTICWPFRTFRPVAPTHALVIPKKHIDSFNEATPGDAALLGKLLLAAQRVAREARLESQGGARS